MQINKLTSILCIPILTLAGCFSPFAKTTMSKKSQFYAGFAKQEFPVQFGKPLAGYRERKHNSTGVHDTVYARAMILDNGKRLGFVSCDLLVIPNELREKVLNELTELKLDDLILSATHTHSSIGQYWDNAIGEWAVMPKYNRHREAEIIQTIVYALEQANQDLEPAEIGVGTANIDLVYNRHIRGGHESRELGVIVFKDLEENIEGYLTTYGAHPTILGPDNTLISADYPGALCEYLEKEGAVNLFFAGALGDQAPERIKPYHKFDRVKDFGRKLAEEVKKLSEKIQFTSDLDIKVNTKKIDLHPYDFLLIPNSLFPLELIFDIAIGFPFVPGETTLQLIKLNDTYLAATPCDLGVNAGEKIKRSIHGTLFPLSQCNGYIGYVLTSQDYSQFGYANLISFHGRFISNYFANEFREMSKFSD